jgi:hypothetical protein
MSNIRANDEYRSEVGATNRPENIVIRYVNFVSLFRLFVCTVDGSGTMLLQSTLDGFSAFAFSTIVSRGPVMPRRLRWGGPHDTAPPSRRRSQPMRESNTSNLFFLMPKSSCLGSFYISSIHFIFFSFSLRHDTKKQIFNKFSKLALFSAESLARVNEPEPAKKFR